MSNFDLAHFASHAGEDAEESGADLIGFQNLPQLVVQNTTLLGVPFVLAANAAYILRVVFNIFVVGTWPGGTVTLAWATLPGFAQGGWRATALVGPSSTIGIIGTPTTTDGWAGNVRTSSFTFPLATGNGAVVTADNNVVTSSTANSWQPQVTISPAGATVNDGAQIVAGYMTAIRGA